MQSQLQSHTQAQSSARLRVAGRFLQCLVLLLLLPLSAALAPRAAMAQVQTEYRYDPAGNVKSVTSVPLGAAPRLQVVRSPKPMRVGEAARVDWVATDATSLTQSCVPFGGGEPYVQDKPLTGNANVQVSADWVTAPPTCTWTAKNAAGQTTSFVEVLTTQAAPVQPPSITNARFSPQTVAVGGTSQLCWNAAHVSRTTVSCSPHYDYQYDVSSTAGGVVCGPADRRAVAVGEGACTIKGFNAAGATTEVTARITVVAAPEITAAGFASSTVTQGSGNSLSWTLGGGAVSSSVTCSGVAAGAGTSSPVAVSTSGTGTGTCTIRAVNAAGVSVERSVSYQSVAAPSISGASFSPQTVAVGGTSQLCWNAAHVSRTTVSCSPHYDYQYDVSSTAGGVVCGPADRRAVAAGEGVCTITGFNAAGGTSAVTARITVVAAPEITAAGFASSTVTQGSGNSLSWTLGGSAVSASVTCSGVAAGSGTSSPVAVSTMGTGTGTCTIRAVSAAGASVERSVSYQSVAAPSISGASFSPQTVAVGGTSQLCWNAAHVSRTTVSCSPHYDYQYDVSSTAGGVVCGPADRRAVAAGEGVCTIKGFNAAGATTEVTARITVVAAPEITAAGFASSTVTQGSGNSLSWTLGGSAVSASVTCSGVAAGSGTSSPVAVSTSGTGTGTCTIRAVNAAGASVERSVSYQSVAAPSISGARFSPQTVAVGGTSQLCWSAAHVSRMTVTCSPHYDYRYDEASTGGDAVCGPADRRAVAVGEGVCTIKGFNAAGATSEVTARIRVEGAVLLSQTYPGVTAGAGTVRWEVMPLNYSAGSGTFVLSNNGTGTATNLSIAATAPWTVQNNSCGTSLEGGKSCTYTLQFTPTAVQAYTGSLTVTSNQGSATPYALAGEGGTTVLSQTYPGAVAGVSAVDWGNVPVDLPTESDVFTLRNAGTAAATSVRITVTGGAFALQSNTCGQHLAAGDSCFYTVSFNPSTCTNYEGRLSITSAQGEALPFQLKGMGMPLRSSASSTGNQAQRPGDPC